MAATLTGPGNRSISSINITTIVRHSHYPQIFMDIISQDGLMNRPLILMGMVLGRGGMSRSPGVRETIPASIMNGIQPHNCDPQISVRVTLPKR
jgi:hypothetical protein